MVDETLILTSSFHTQTIFTLLSLHPCWVWEWLWHLIRNSVQQRQLPYQYCSFLCPGQTSLINHCTFCYHIKTRLQILSIVMLQVGPTNWSELTHEIKTICHPCPFKCNLKQQLRGRNWQWVIIITANIYWALILLPTLCAWGHLSLTQKLCVMQILFLSLFYKPGLKVR